MGEYRPSTKRWSPMADKTGRELVGGVTVPPPPELLPPPPPPQAESNETANKDVQRDLTKTKAPRRTFS